MINLAFAAAFLPLSHFLISSTPISRGAVRRSPWRAALFSGLFAARARRLRLAIIAYRGARRCLSGRRRPAVQLAAFPIILLAALLVVTGLTTPNPAMVGAQALLDRPDIARGVLRVSRNPFFWGAGVFALMHIALSGDGAGVPLFGRSHVSGLAGRLSAPPRSRGATARPDSASPHELTIRSAPSASTPALALRAHRRVAGAFKLGIALFLA